MHPNQNHNSRKKISLKYILWYIFIILNLSRNLNVVFILIKNWFSFCYIHFSETWCLKNLWKIHENFSVSLSLFSPLNLSYSLHFFRSHSLFCPLSSAVSVSMLKSTKWTGKSFKTKLNQKTNLQQPFSVVCSCTNHLSTTD